MPHVDITRRVRANSRPQLARPRARRCIRSVKRNIRNECAILIRRVKGTLRERSAVVHYISARVSAARVTSSRGARERRSARMQHATPRARVFSRGEERARGSAPPEYRRGGVRIRIRFLITRQNDNSQEDDPFVKCRGFDGSNFSLFKQCVHHRDPPT